MRLRRKYGVCDEVRGVYIAYRGMQANIGNPGFQEISRIRRSLNREWLHTAAPPAIVPNKQLLISMTFLTV